MLGDDPLWYKDAVIYEIHVRAFCDGDADGIGDFKGLTSKLDYLQDLGVTALWLLPFYPSPLRDDGYDIADYLGIHPSYGVIDDFKEFLAEAHRRGLRVITELVMNHTSDQHPWFQAARRAAPGSPERDFYVWSDSPKKYKEARIIFKDYESSNWTWDPVAKSYYWHRFFFHQPDLNYDNPAVGRAMLEALDFWLGLGVDGLRIDAVPYLFEREGSNCENLPETHAFLRDVRRHVDEKFPNRMLLAEANQWPEDAIAYFGKGDECHMAFHFPVMPRLFMAIRMEDRHPIVEIMKQTPPIPETCQWAVFLRNHDELTLEMVTDEDRDYMYRVYAQDPQARINLGIRRRLAPLLGNHRRRIELMNALLFSLPGSPVLYYGDEIGMGDNIYLGDRNGVRTPMQWSADRNAGFSRASPQRLFLPISNDAEYHYEAVNVDAQQQNRHSLLWWTKRMIALRRRHRAFSRGSIEFLAPENRKVLSFIRRHEGEAVLVVANLARFPQWVELDLSPFRGMVLRELFGHTRFPLIREAPYILTLAPHGFYWFAIEPARGAVEVAASDALPILAAPAGLEALLAGPERGALEALLPPYLARCRWFRGKARTVQGARITEVVPVPIDANAVQVLLVEVSYVEGEIETYILPVEIVAADAAAARDREGIARLRLSEGREGLLVDAMGNPRFPARLLAAIGQGERFPGGSGRLAAWSGPAFSRIRGQAEMVPEPTPVRAEQSNTSVVFGDRMVLKLYRQLESGVNLDLEIGRFLTEQRAFPHTPDVAGAIEWQVRRGEPRTVAVLQAFVPNEGDAWRYARDAVSDFFDRILARRAAVGEPPQLPRSLVDAAEAGVPKAATDLIGHFIESAALLGKRTAEMHIALASAPEDPAFAPEPFSTLYQRSLYQSQLTLIHNAFELLRRRMDGLGARERELAARLLAREEELRRRVHTILTLKVTSMRTRYHGDYHLGQVLFTGKDFVIIDFEGEPLRPLSERRIKRSPLRDVAGMVRSFQYVALFTLRNGRVRPDDAAWLEPWARHFAACVSAVFLRSYLAAAAPGGFLPAAPDELRALLEFYLLEKAVYELGYELNNRPDWSWIPLEGILSLLEERP